MNDEYRTQADALDARIRAAIAAFTLDDGAFDALACDVFAHQFRWNAAYAAYARSLGISESSLPRTAAAIPAVPAAAFKDAVLCTVAPERAALWFETSGTTQSRCGRHYLESPHLYEAALLAGFDRAMLADGAALRYALLVPDPRERPHSSLGYMMATVARRTRRRTERLVPARRRDRRRPAARRRRARERRRRRRLRCDDRVCAGGAARRTRCRRTAAAASAGLARDGDRRLQGPHARRRTRRALRAHGRRLRAR